MDSTNNSKPISARLQKRLDAIHLEVCELHFKYRYFAQLFMDKQSLQIATATAPSFFGHIQNVMLHDIILCIGRLTDPAGPKSRENLSFYSILADIHDVSLHAEVCQIVSNIKAKTGAIRNWRNKKLAHNDLANALHDTHLQPIYVADLEEVIKLTGNIVNIFYRRFRDMEVAYDECITSGDGDSLMFYLEYGLDAWKEDKRNHNIERLQKLSKNRIARENFE
jgi:hypothetical protein